MKYNDNNNNYYYCWLSILINSYFIGCPMLNYQVYVCLTTILIDLFIACRY